MITHMNSYACAGHTLLSSIANKDGLHIISYDVYTYDGSNMIINMLNNDKVEYMVGYLASYNII